MGRWDTSDRRSRLPADWHKRRRDVLKRDGYRCTWEDVTEGRHRARCANTTDLEVDHRIPGDDHSLENLRTLCHHHHLMKTNAEGHAALNKKRSEIRGRFRRDTSREHLGGDGIPLWAKWSA